MAQQTSPFHQLHNPPECNQPRILVYWIGTCIFVELGRGAFISEAESHINIVFAAAVGDDCGLDGGVFVVFVASTVVWVSKIVDVFP